MPNTRATKDDIANLIKGKASKNKVGSRTVPHRLNKIELIKFEKATKLGFLKYSSKTRLALLNSFDEYLFTTKKISLKVNTDINQIEILSLNTELIELTYLKLKDLNPVKINSNFVQLQFSKENLNKVIEQINLS